MKTKNRNHILLGSVLLLIIGILVGCVAEPAHISLSSTTYLPLVSKLPGRPTIFGVEVSSYTNDKVLAAATNTQTNWMRINGLLWSDVQPNHPSEWLWSNEANLEQGLIQASSGGIKAILVVRSTPLWAQMYSGFFCGPVRAESLDAFATFMAETVHRYSVPPYNVSYYEIWNEPDVDHTGFPPDSPYGCWGNINDAYYGGDTYALMLQKVYPAMKAANPGIQVVLGGLLLDCDPTYPAVEGYCDSEVTAIPPRFFEGILRSGGSDYFDIVSFHGYPTYSITYTVPMQAESIFPTWSAQGGVVQGKINYLREIMTQYNVSKPIIHSEGSLLFDSGDAFEEAKADYLVWLYARNWSEGIYGTIWFTLNGPGWRNSGLLDQNQDPLPAYQAYKFMAQELAGATFISKTEDPSSPGMVDFLFQKWSTNIHIFIPIDGNTHDIMLPTGWTALYDTYGNPIISPGNPLPIQHPVYLEMGQ